MSTTELAYNLTDRMTDGESMLLALENIHTVMGEWIETAKLLGREIPVPKGKLAFA